MRKHIKFFAFVGIACLLIVATVSCQKSRYCRCITTEVSPADTIIINMDKSMSCKRLQTMGHETMINGEPQITLHTYSCEKLHKDTVPTIPHLPYED